jgi:hypothetical protein
MATKRLMRSAYYLVNRAPSSPAMSRAARSRLEAFYAPYNHRLAAQLAGIGLELPPSW